ncbi:MAG: phage holin family protein [Myxococcota bacterium]
MSILINWLILTVVFLATASILPGVKVKDFKAAVVVAAIYGTLNWTIGWLLFGLIGIGTLGLGFLFGFITQLLVATILLKLTDVFTDRLKIDSMGTAFIAALVMAALGTAANAALRALS